MYRFLVACLCIWAAAALTEAKPHRRKGGQQPRRGKDARDEPEYDDGPFLPGQYYSYHCVYHDKVNPPVFVLDVSLWMIITLHDFIA